MFTRKMLFLAVATLLCATVAFAQSSGNFSYSTTGNGTNTTAPIACTMDTNGKISGGFTCVHK